VTTYPVKPRIDVAVAVVFNAGGQVLWGCRPEGKPYAGYWEFPGGKVDAGDDDVAAAALREAYEEVGMARSDARVMGFMQPYFTGTNYLITPVVAVVEPSGPFVPNPGEVHSVFEVPLQRILRPESYGQFRIKRDGKEHRTWQIDHDGHRTYV